MGECTGDFVCSGNERFNAHRGAAFAFDPSSGRGWAKQGVNFVDTLNGSASSPQIRIAQVFDIVFLSGISEMVVVSSEQHCLRLFPRVLAEYAP